MEEAPRHRMLRVPQGPGTRHRPCSSCDTAGGTASLHHPSPVGLWDEPRALYYLPALPIRPPVCCREERKWEAGRGERG